MVGVRAFTVTHIDGAGHPVWARPTRDYRPPAMLPSTHRSAPTPSEVRATIQRTSPTAHEVRAVTWVPEFYMGLLLTFVDRVCVNAVLFTSVPHVEALGWSPWATAALVVTYAVCAVVAHMAWLPFLTSRRGDTPATLHALVSLVASAVACVLLASHPSFTSWMVAVVLLGIFSLESCACRMVFSFAPTDEAYSATPREQELWLRALDLRASYFACVTPAAMMVVTCLSVYDIGTPRLAQSTFSIFAAFYFGTFLLVLAGVAVQYRSRRRAAARATGDAYSVRGVQAVGDSDELSSGVIGTVVPDHPVSARTLMDQLSQLADMEGGDEEDADDLTSAVLLRGAGDAMSDAGSARSDLELGSVSSLSSLDRQASSLFRRRGNEMAALTRALLSGVRVDDEDEDVFRWDDDPQRMEEHGDSARDHSTRALLVACATAGAIQNATDMYRSALLVSIGTWARPLLTGVGVGGYVCAAVCGVLVSRRWGTRAFFSAWTLQAPAFIFLALATLLLEQLGPPGYVWRALFIVPATVAGCSLAQAPIVHSQAMVWFRTVDGAHSAHTYNVYAATYAGRGVGLLAAWAIAHLLDASPFFPLAALALYGARFASASYPHVLEMMLPVSEAAQRAASSIPKADAALVGRDDVL